MKRSEAAKYARWSAAAALVCAGLTVGVYLKRGWTRHVEREKAPPAPAVNVERQSSLLTFSKVDRNRTIFTVEASKSIDFKGINASDLEGVKVTIFGQDGARHDMLETHSCRYTKDTGDIACSGNVDITLMSEEQWKASGGKPGAAGTMKVETRGVSFNRASGEAKTDEPVRFLFANGSGEALGADYRSEQGTLQLLRNVSLKLEQPAAGKGKTVAAPPKEPILVTGSRMEFQRDAGTMYLAGPAEAKTQTERLKAAGLLLELDEDFHAKRLVARGDGAAVRPEFTARKGAGEQRLSAQELVADFAQEGWVKRAEAKGQVTGEAMEGGAGGEKDSVQAESAVVEMAPGVNEPKLLVLKGGVDARTTATAGGGESPDTRRLTTDELRIHFAQAAARKGVRLENAETAGQGRLEWNDAGGSGSGKAAQAVLQADQLGMQFDARGLASRLDAKGNVRTERAIAGGNKQTATAANGFVELQPGGGWSQMQLKDKVQLTEGQRSARADQATFTRAAQNVTLTGHATVRDAGSQTSAQKLTFWQESGEIKGEGNVRTSDLSARSGSVRLGPAAASISADELAGNSKSGRALYSGHARLWQGDSVLEAESIELLRNERMLRANGNVRAVFPQAGERGKSAGGPPVLWHAQSEKLTYWDRESRARLERNVVVQAPEQKMSCEALDLFFTRANGGQGGQQISRAVGSGGVTVQQGERRATAERGEYTAMDGKFVMSGGTPTILDAGKGTTTGRQLTFFLADATIIVDSDNGSRTLTKHRVEK